MNNKLENTVFRSAVIDVGNIRSLPWDASRHTRYEISTILYRRKSQLSLNNKLLIKTAILKPVWTNGESL